MTEDAGSKAGELVDDILTDEDGIDAADSTQKESVNIQGMLLGERRDNGETIDVSPFVLARHAAMLGSTGSGKTVMAKALIEEAAIAEIPSLIIDPQGDLARLALRVDEDELVAKGGMKERMQNLHDKMEIRIWTPLRSKGLPLCIDPFRSPPNDLDQEEAITAWDMVAAGFSNLAGFDVEKTDGKVVKPFLYEILVHGNRLGVDVSNFQSLAKVVREPHESFLKILYPQCFNEDEENREEMISWDEASDEYGLRNFEDMLPKTKRNALARRLAAFSSGVNQLLFSNGVPIDMDAFCTPATEGKIPINIVYLNTIQDEAQKQYFVQELSRELYDWMLTQQPADGELKMLFFMDEVAPYLPPYPRNPPAKDLIKLIFKQARKYGVACVLATQNVSDVDYKILAQANTTFIGRFTQPQDVEKVRHLLKESGGDQDLVAQLPTLGPGQFQMVAPDVDAAPIPLQCRWLYTDHGAPLSEDQVEEVTTDEIRDWAKSQSSGKSRASGKGAASAAAHAVSHSTSQKGVVEAARVSPKTGMAAAAHGVVDDAAFEVRLMGGLSVLKDGRDPLYIMQAAVNGFTSIVLGWTLIALLLGWQEEVIDWWWILGGFFITSGVILVISLEMFLSHDTELLRKISQFARTTQILIAAWLWILLIWSLNDLNLRGAEPLLEVVVVWMTLFILIDFINRVKLGKLQWKGGSAFQKLKGLTALITESELTDMQSNSKQIMAGLRWFLDLVTLVWLSVMLMELDSHSVWQRGLLWLASVYALMFMCETWIRLRKNADVEG